MDTDATAGSPIAKHDLVSSTRSKRTATVYDAVAGRVGLNGFLTAEQLRSRSNLPLKPEEVLLRRVNAPSQVSYDYYGANEKLSSDQTLPESDLLKAIHAYTSDYYTSAIEGGQVNCGSFDETALLAMGILMEEASREVLGENGDMVLVEPEGLEKALSEPDFIKHQIIGKVKPRVTQPVIAAEEEEEDSDELEGEKSPRKKRRWHSGDGPE